MKIVILTNEWPNMCALSHKVYAKHELACIVISKNIPKNKKSLSISQFVTKAANRVLGYPLKKAWDGMMTKYSKLYPNLPDVPVVHVDNVNDFDTLQTIENYSPDIVMVSGTNLVGEKIIEMCETNQILILNLHTGLSPYIKGGPNCTNWCLATGNFHLIGNTVMKLDAGIDSGPIIATEQTRLTGKESLTELHWKVMEHGFELYCAVVDRISKSKNVTVQTILQDEIGQGVTYYNRDWNTWQVIKAEWNFLFSFNVKNLSDSVYIEKSNKLKFIEY